MVRNQNNKKEIKICSWRVAMEGVIIVNLPS